ncbi:MAG: M23 family metallopeptidase [bacterium]
MSSAKRTPRYVDAIRSYDLAARSSPDVIRLRPEMLGPTLPPITRGWPRRKAVPVAQRPWQLLLVSPTPGAPTRSFHVARWHARLVVIAASTLLLIAASSIAAVGLAVRSPDLFATSAEAALLRARLTIVEDSLALARAELEAPDDSLAMAASAASVKPSAPGAAAAARRIGTRPAPAAARPFAKPSAAASRDDDTRSLTSGGIEGLPVIGAIASRFSRARRHPLLHVIRPHLGVDVAAPRGTRIVAPAPGRVSFVGRKFGFGLVVEIQHSDGVSTRYAHCGRALVAEGDHVQRGVAIATVGTSGLSTGPHLHYEVLVHGHQVDPLRFRMPPMADGAMAGSAAVQQAGAGLSVASPGAATFGAPAPR